LFGPTCDSADVMHGPFLLPADATEGDWIEIGQLGAYGACLRTAFNGFDRARIVEVAGLPVWNAIDRAAPALRIAV
jgi:ornithine decarboxylase